MTHTNLLRLAAFLLGCGFIVAAWTWWRTAIDVEQLVAWLAVYRHTWYALLFVTIAFVVLGLVMVPVLLLIAATGIAFGPLLGPVYAFAGCLASASTGFAIGRWVGLRRVQRLFGDRVTRVTQALNRNGTLAVFLARKVPAPFTLVNIVVGASTVRFVDFIIGTVLGMGAIIIGLAGFGYQLVQAWHEPTPQRLIGAGLFIAVPLMLALLINRAFQRLRPAR